MVVPSGKPAGIIQLQNVNWAGLHISIKGNKVNGNVSGVSTVALYLEGVWDGARKAA